MILIELTYLLAIILLAIYGLNSLYLTYRFWQQSLPLPPPPEPDIWPTVTVQLPIYNERHTVTRLLQAVLALDYPAGRLHIQVLDDSTDDTPAIIAAAIRELAPPPGLVQVIHRTRRTHFKAGALAAGLQHTNSEFIAIFDADFVPTPDFLRRVIPHFAAPDIGCVQTRWGHTNRDYSLFTRTQALGIDGHFMIEQPARADNRFYLNFNGTAGIWRRQCIDGAGGWQGDTLTEDLDLSYRAQLRGWRIAYLRDVVVPAELPVQISAYKRQQARWARGSIQTARKLLGTVWRSPAGWWHKLQSTLHLTGYLVHPLMLAAILLALPMAFSRNWWLIAVGALLSVAAIGPPLMFISAQVALKHPRRIAAMPLLLLLGFGLTLNNTQAVLKALFGKQSGTFERTPKFGIQQAGDGWHHSRYALIGQLSWGELSMAALALSSLGLVNLGASWGMYPWLALYALAYCYVGGLSIVEALLLRRQRRESKATVKNKL